MAILFLEVVSEIIHKSTATRMYATGGMWLRFHGRMVHLLSCAHILWRVGTATGHFSKDSESYCTLKVADPFENKQSLH